MPRRSPVDWDAVGLAAPNLVLTCHELHKLGVTQRMIWLRCRPGSVWTRLLPGVIFLRNGTPNRQQRLDAALRYAGPGAMLTGLAAAQLHGLKRFPATDQVHVLVPAEKQPNSCGYVLVERTIRVPEVVPRQGFPAADVTRAVLDATRRMADRATIEALLAEAVQRSYTTPTKLTTELKVGSDRGSARPRQALRGILHGVRSTAEADARRLLLKSGLPLPKWNVPLKTRSGQKLPTSDAWFDQVALAWEIDSLEFHLSPEDYARTLRRHATMTAAGVLVLHTLPSRLKKEPEAVIAELRAAYDQAKRRPRPAILVG